jgi:CDGSH-type Zn-finger protein
MAEHTRTTRIQVVPGGPCLVRGADVIRDGDGVDHEVGRPVVAVCMCGLTQRAPWCDGTHKVAQRK